MGSGEPVNPPKAPRTLASLGATLLAGCLNTVTIAAPLDGGQDAIGPDAVASPLDLGMPEVRTWVDAPADAVAPPIDRGSPPVGGVRCGEATCAPGEACCLVSGRCFDPAAHPEQCAPPPQDAGERPRCASHADCGPEEYCVPAPGSVCFGPGYCQPRSSCASCRGPSAACAVCGCDGLTYASPQLACQAGVRTAGARGACGAGVVEEHPFDAGGRPQPLRHPCAHDAQCPSAQRCCQALGVCVEAACATCCRPPPPGTNFPCERDEQCFPSEYCAGEGCGTPGGCTLVRGTGPCSGIVTQVCGCDGRTYINACWATGVGMRVAGAGACP